MTRITHIFFDVHDVLVDRARLGRCYSANLGLIMAERYGLTPTEWTQAYRRILTDWDSYYSDLDLSGDDGIEHMWEGVFRTTRAMFRLTRVPEPPKPELTALARELPGLAAQACDVLYAEVPEVVAKLDEAGIVLGVISYSLSGEIRASLAPILEHFKGAIWGADNAEHFEKDAERFRQALDYAHAAPEQCLMLDDKPAPLINARQVGMQAIRVDRKSPPSEGVWSDLRGLVEYLSLGQPR